MKHIYVTVRLDVEDSADTQDVVQECDYSFVHDEIIDHEIVDIDENYNVHAELFSTLRNNKK